MRKRTEIVQITREDLQRVCLHLARESYGQAFDSIVGRRPTGDSAELLGRLLPVLRKRPQIAS